MRRKREETDMMEKYEIQKLRDLPIEEVAKEMGIKVEHHKALCPFHDDHHASLTFSTKKNSCRCYVCMSESIGTIDLVMRYLGKDFLSACRWLAEEHQVCLEDDRKREGSASSLSSKASYAGGSSSEDNSGGSSSGKSSSFDASRYARFFEHPWLNEAARRFLFEERKIDWRVVNWCRLTSWTDRDGVNWLQIPYFDMEGRLIGIQNRNLDFQKGQDAPRFRFPYGARCSIYNLPVVKRLAVGERLFITEGCSDCWAMLSAGHKAIAIPSATLLKPEDKKWLVEMGEKLRIEWHMFPDKDAPGEQLFLQLKEILPSLVHHQLPPGCKDFSEYYQKSFCPFYYICTWKNKEVKIFISANFC